VKARPEPDFRYRSTALARHEVTERRAGNDGEDVDIGRRPRKAVKDGDDERRPAPT